MSVGIRRQRVGTVVGDGNDKTIVVSVAWRQRHRVYMKHVRRVTKLMAHDTENIAKNGDKVRVEETRPLSKRKRWRLVEIIERADLLPISPKDADVTLDAYERTGASESVAEGEASGATTNMEKAEPNDSTSNKT